MGVNRSFVRAGAWRAVLITVAAAALLGWSAAFTPVAAVHLPPCGDWMFVPSPSPAAGGSAVYDVDAVSSDDVWSVGSSGSAARPLALHWNGTDWSEVSTPSPSATYNNLSGIAAIAPDDAWAVGIYNPAGGASQTLALHWNGSTWSIRPSPFIAGGSAFFAVDPLSASEIWAVGSRNVGAPGPDEGPLTARWNGSAWVEVPAPYIGLRINRLFAVDARASNDAWAVGTWRNIGSTFHILITHWDGNSWTIMTPPDPGQNDELSAVQAVSANDVWAVGDRYDAVEGPQPLIMHWNGSAWTQHSLPVFPGGLITLSALEAAAPDDIWAAGTDATDAGDPRPLLMHWDGATWSVVSAGPTGGSGEWFRGLAVASACDVWAVGSYSNGLTQAPLAERLLPSPSSVAGGDAPGGVLRLVAFPNPAPGETTIHLDGAGDGMLHAEIFDVQGRRVRSLADRRATSGAVALVWNGLDDHGQRVSAGQYFVRVIAASSRGIARVVMR